MAKVNHYATMSVPRLLERHSHFRIERDPDGTWVLTEVRGGQVRRRICAESEGAAYRVASRFIRQGLIGFVAG